VSARTTFAASKVSGIFPKQMKTKAQPDYSGPRTMRSAIFISLQTAVVGPLHVSDFKTDSE